MTHEDVHRYMMDRSFGQGHDITLKVGVFSRNSFRAMIRGIEASGLRIRLTEGRDWLDCVWHVDGELKALDAVKKYVASLK